MDSGQGHFTGLRLLDTLDDCIQTRSMDLFAQRKYGLGRRG